MKYPMNTFYGAFSPRVSAAWNPKFDSGILGKLFGNGKTVLRGGYGRIWGRLNGVNLVLVPLLGIGPLQPVTCAGPSMTGQCLGANNVDPTNVFRIGTDGMSAPLPAPSPTLAQPFFMGYNGAIYGRRRQHARSQLPAGAHRQLQHLAATRAALEDDARGRLYRPDHPQRDAGDEPGCRAVHDHPERPELRAGLCHRLQRVGRQRRGSRLGRRPAVL